MYLGVVELLAGFMLSFLLRSLVADDVCEDFIGFDMIELNVILGYA